MVVKAERSTAAPVGTRSRTTDDRGAVRLWGYSPGTYRVCAIPELRGRIVTRRRGSFEPVIPSATPTEAQPLAGRDRRTRRKSRSAFAAAVSSGISGVVIDASGQLAPAASVSLVISIERFGDLGRTTFRTHGGNFIVCGTRARRILHQSRARRIVPDPDDKTRPRSA